MKRRLALFAVAVVLTGCGSGGTGTSPTGGAATTTTTSSVAAAPGDETAAWVDRVCGAGLGAVKALATQPQLDSGDAATMQRQFADWLGGGSAAVSQSIKDVEVQKQGPHPDSEKLVTTLVENLGQVRTVLDEAKTTVEAANSTDVAAIVTAVTQVAADLAAAAETADNFTDVLVRANLAEALRSAPNCQAVQAGGK